MGSGKSLLGRKLAGLLKKEFLDLDHYIEAGEQRSIADIFQEAGEASFRNMESLYLQRAMSLPAAVISLGGGTVCFNNNLAAIKNAGLLVYIELNAAALADRLKNTGQTRPLLKGLSGEAMTQRIAELLEQRKEFYVQAHLRVQGLNLTALALKQKISEAAQEDSH